MSVITIDTSQLMIGAGRIKALNNKIASIVNDVANATALEIAAKAKDKAPADRGFLRQHISVKKEFLKKTISVNAPYAAYMEFGTGVYAAQYVATLPADWATFAAQFKSKGQNKGTFYEFVNAILDWVIRKGFAARYNVQTRKRIGTGRGKAETNRAIEIAYVIAWSIIKKGVKPNGYLFKAFKEQEPQFQTDLQNALRTTINLR